MQRKSLEHSKRRPIKRVRFLWVWNSGAGNIGDAIVWTPFSKEVSGIIETALLEREAIAKYTIDGKGLLLLSSFAIHALTLSFVYSIQGEHS
jgi:hypothetical protein